MDISYFKYLKYKNKNNELSTFLNNQHGGKLNNDDDIVYKIINKKDPELFTKIFNEALKLLAICFPHEDIILHEYHYDIIIGAFKNDKLVGMCALIIIDTPIKNEEKYFQRDQELRQIYDKNFLIDENYVYNEKKCGYALLLLSSFRRKGLDKNVLKNCKKYYLDMRYNIISLAVHPEFRKKGIASKILELCKQYVINKNKRLKEKNKKYLFNGLSLEIDDEDYDNLLKFYLKNGFKKYDDPYNISQYTMMYFDI
jgi:GNAT superfamily N-acetyltransferase